MAVRITRLGSPRARAEGLRLGTVRRPPRGVRKADYAARDYFDVWLPELAPSAKLVDWALSEPLTDKRWAGFVSSYRREMQEPARRRLLLLLALLSRQTNFSVGCYCEREDRCHRSILRELLAENGARLARPLPVLHATKARLRLAAGKKGEKEATRMNAGERRSAPTPLTGRPRGRRR